MEIERHNAEEDKYRLYLFHSGFCCHYANFSAFWVVMLVLEVFANHRQSLIATYALGLPSIVIIMSGVGALRSNIRPQRKFYNIIMSIFMLLFLMTVNVTCQVFFHYFDNVNGITSLLQIFWGCITILAVTIPIDVMSPLDPDDRHMTRTYISVVWFFQTLSTGSLLFALEESYDDEDSSAGFRYTLAYAFGANVIIYSSIVPALRAKINRVTFMMILDFFTNLPVIVVALSTGSHLGRLAVPVMVLLQVVQCCHDMVYEVVKTWHDECEHREQHREQHFENSQAVEDARKGFGATHSAPNESLFDFDDVLSQRPNNQRERGDLGEGTALPQNRGLAFGAGSPTNDSTYRQNPF